MWLIQSLCLLIRNTFALFSSYVSCCEEEGPGPRVALFLRSTVLPTLPPPLPQPRASRFSNVLSVFLRYSRHADFYARSWNFFSPFLFFFFLSFSPFLFSLVFSYALDELNERNVFTQRKLRWLVLLMFRDTFDSSSSSFSSSSSTCIFLSSRYFTVNVAISSESCENDNNGRAL